MAKKKDDKRFSVTLHFKRGVDDEVIERIEAIDSGERSETLKTVLGLRKDKIKPLAPDYVASLDDLTKRVYWIQQFLDAIPMERLLSVADILPDLEDILASGLTGAGRPRRAKDKREQASAEALAAREAQMKKQDQW